MSRRSFQPLAAAALIIVSGAVAIAVVPRHLPAPGPGGGVQRDGGPGTVPKVKTGSRLTAMRVVEGPSPIVGADGTLREALGIENVGDRFVPMIARGATSPASTMFSVGTAPERPDEIRFHLLRGTSERAGENHSLGHFRITHLPPGEPGTARALVILRVIGGAVQAAAVHPRTLEPLTLERVESSSGP